MELKNRIVYISVLIFAIVFLFVGNRMVSETVMEHDNVIPPHYYSGVVVEVVGRTIRDFGWDVGSVDIEFEARITTRGDKQGQVIVARQQITDFTLVNEREVTVGDRVILFYSAWSGNYYFDHYMRINYVAILGAIFVLLMLLFGRKKGFNALVSLGLTCLAIFLVFIPAILSGRNIYITTFIICIYAIVTTLLIVIGSNKKAFSAMMGCFGGVLMAGGIMLIMDHILRLTGALDRETESLLLLPTETPISLRAIIFAGVILGAVGAIMDVAMSISSSLWEIKEAGGKSDFKSIVKSGINIGQDILGTMLNTLILAYIGSSLSLILLINVDIYSMLSLFNWEMIIVEFLRALVGSIGMLLTIPLTATICAWVYTRDTPNV